MTTTAPRELWKRLLRNTAIFSGILATGSLFQYLKYKQWSESRPFVLDISLGNLAQTSLLKWVAPSPRARLFEIERDLLRAAADPRCVGVYLDVNHVPGSLSLADMEDLQFVLRKFRTMTENKKPILAFVSRNDMASYTGAAAANLLAMRPDDHLLFPGLSQQSIYLGDFFKKHQIQVDVFKREGFKTAFESFSDGRMSAAHRENWLRVMSPIIARVKSLIHTSRGVAPQKLDELMNDGLVDGATLLRERMIDFAAPREILKEVYLCSLASSDTSSVPEVSKRMVQILSGTQRVDVKYPHFGQPAIPGFPLMSVRDAGSKGNSSGGGVGGSETADPASTFGSKTSSKPNKSEMHQDSDSSSTLPDLAYQHTFWNPPSPDSSFLLTVRAIAGNLVESIASSVSSSSSSSISLQSDESDESASADLLFQYSSLQQMNFAAENFTVDSVLPTDGNNGPNQGSVKVMLGRGSNPENKNNFLSVRAPPRFRRHEDYLEEFEFFRSFRELFRGFFQPQKRLGSHIALVFAEGGIAEGSSGAGGGSNLSAQHFIKTVETAIRDPRVGAMVVRLDSPGGDAVASDAMRAALRHMSRVHKKPVVVSMASVAASGGYLTALGADVSLAQETSITGSIGVIMARPAIHNFLKQHGLNPQEINTHEGSKLLTPLSPLTDRHRNWLDTMVDRTYSAFRRHVRLARKLSDEEVRNAAQGKVWAGAEAKDLKLIDGLGGLHVAIETAKDILLETRSLAREKQLTGPNFTISKLRKSDLQVLVDYKPTQRTLFSSFAPEIDAKLADIHESVEKLSQIVQNTWITVQNISHLGEWISLAKDAGIDAHTLRTQLNLPPTTLATSTSSTSCGLLMTSPVFVGALHGRHRSSASSRSLFSSQEDVASSDASFSKEQPSDEIPDFADAGFVSVELRVDVPKL